MERMALLVRAVTLSGIALPRGNTDLPACLTDCELDHAQPISDARGGYSTCDLLRYSIPLTVSTRK